MQSRNFPPKFKIENLNSIKITYTCDIFSSSCSCSGTLFPCSTASSFNRSRVSIALNINVKLCRPVFFFVLVCVCVCAFEIQWNFHEYIAFCQYIRSNGAVEMLHQFLHKCYLYVPTGETRWHRKPRKHKPSSSNSDSMTNGGANAVTIRNTVRAPADKPVE